MVVAVGPRKHELLHVLDPHWKQVSLMAGRERERKEKEDWLAHEEDDEDEIRGAHDHAAYGALMGAWADEDEVRVRTLPELLGLEPDAVASLGGRA